MDFAHRKILWNPSFAHVNLLNFLWVPQSPTIFLVNTRYNCHRPLDYLFGEIFNIDSSTYHGIGEYSNDFIPIYNYINDIQRLTGFKSCVQDFFKNRVSNFNFKGCSRFSVVAACEAWAFKFSCNQRFQSIGPKVWMFYYSCWFQYFSINMLGRGPWGSLILATLQFWCEACKQSCGPK